MKYLTWFRKYSDGTGCAYSFDSIEKALSYATQYSPFTDIYKENKIYIEDETGKIIITSRVIKEKIRSRYPPNLTTR